MVTWDGRKRQRNLLRHGVDFLGCEAVFDYPVVTAEDPRDDYGEQRINLLGWWQGTVIHMTYTERGENLHVISLRKATKHMKQGNTSRPFPRSAEEIQEAIQAAPDEVSGSEETPYDPNEEKAVRAFWKNAEIRRPGQRGPGKKAKKILLSMRYSPEVVEYFRATGKGWQTRMDEALKEWVAAHR